MSAAASQRAARRPPQHGFFFSVWKKQAGGDWKVVLDVGIETNTAYRGPRELRTGVSAGITSPGTVNQPGEQADLFAVELALQESARTTGMASAYSRLLNGDSRLHRNGLQPLVGRKAIVQYLSQNKFIPVWKPEFANIARSGDLGYVYGSYQLTGNKPDVVLERGYYARVWKRAANNKWLMELDTTSPITAD